MDETRAGKCEGRRKPGGSVPGSLSVQSPFWRSDHARMTLLKVLPCACRSPHSWADCPFAHPGESVRRRSLGRVAYSSDLCPHMRRAEPCPAGEECTYAHNVFEQYLVRASFDIQPARASFDAGAARLSFDAGTAAGPHAAQMLPDWVLIAGPAPQPQPQPQLHRAREGAASGSGASSPPRFTNKAPGEAAAAAAGGLAVPLSSAAPAGALPAQQQVVYMVAPAGPCAEAPPDAPPAWQLAPAPALELAGAPPAVGVTGSAAECLLALLQEAEASSQAATAARAAAAQAQVAADGAAFRAVAFAAERSAGPAPTLHLAAPPASGPLVLPPPASGPLMLPLQLTVGAGPTQQMPTSVALAPWPTAQGHWVAQAAPAPTGQLAVGGGGGGGPFVVVQQPSGVPGPSAVPVFTLLPPCTTAGV